MEAACSHSEAPLATLEQWAALPEEQAAELLHGRLHYKLNPSPEHGRIQRKIGTVLDPYDRENATPGGWWIAQEVDLQLGPDGVRPDVVGWRRDRVPELPEPRPPLGRVSERPDWVCEVLSKTNADRDLVDKLGIYHREKVGHYWILDPEHGTLTVYRWVPEGYLAVLAASRGQRVRAEPFPDIDLDLGAMLAGRA